MSDDALKPPERAWMFVDEDGDLLGYSRKPMHPEDYVEYIRAESLEAEIERLQRSLAILSLRVLQSELVLDEKERAARDWGVELQCAALESNKGGINDS